MDKLEETAALFDYWLDTTQREFSLTEVEVVWLLSEMALRRYNRYITASETASVKEEVPVYLS